MAGSQKKKGRTNGRIVRENGDGKPSKSAGPPDSASQSTHLTFPIVAIGASAGGLEAFSSLLKSLPNEPGIGLVFIPHLDPTHESAMVELLSRTTRLPVLQASEGMRVMNNSVYVLPPNCDMTIKGGILHLARRETGRGHHMPIDTFFRSLADDQGPNAVGVILSGTANDGTLGLSAIKSEGGITFAQDLETAKYDGMPSSAVAAGVVDHVFPPDRIAQELIRIQRQPTPHPPANDMFDGKDRLLKEVFRLLKSLSRFRRPQAGDHPAAHPAAHDHQPNRRSCRLRQVSAPQSAGSGSVVSRRSDQRHEFLSQSGSVCQFA